MELSGLGRFIRGAGPWAYPIVNLTHILGIASLFGATLVIDLRTSVHNYWDRGMLGMALHPSFPGVPYVYVLYAYDAVPGGTPPPSHFLRQSF